MSVIDIAEPSGRQTDRLWRFTERPATVYSECHLERPQLPRGGYRGLELGMERRFDRVSKNRISHAMSEADAIVFMVER